MKIGRNAQEMKQKYGIEEIKTESKAPHVNRRVGLLESQARCKINSPGNAIGL